MRRRRHIGCVAFAAAILLFFTAAARAVELSGEFQDRQYGYSIRYPASWNAAEFRSGVILSEINRNDNTSGLQIRFMRSNRSMKVFVDNYILGFRGEMQATLIRESPTTIDRYRGREIIFRARRGGNEYFLKSYVLRGKEQSGYYVFQAGTLFQERDQVEPILDEIARSFRL